MTLLYEVKDPIYLLRGSRFTGDQAKMDEIVRYLKRLVAENFPNGLTIAPPSYPPSEYRTDTDIVFCLSSSECTRGKDGLDFKLTLVKSRR